MAAPIMMTAMSRRNTEQTRMVRRRTTLSVSLMLSEKMAMRERLVK